MALPRCGFSSTVKNRNWEWWSLLRGKKRRDYWKSLAVRTNNKLYPGLSGERRVLTLLCHPYHSKNKLAGGKSIIITERVWRYYITWFKQRTNQFQVDLMGHLSITLAKKKKQKQKTEEWKKNNFKTCQMVSLPGCFKDCLLHSILLL